MLGLKIAGKTRVLWMVTLLTVLVATVTTGIEALAAEPVPKPGHSLAYVPRDTKLIASVRTSALKTSPGLSSLQEFVAKDQTFKQQTGVSLDRVEQIVLVALTDEEGTTIAIIHTADSDDAALMVKTLQPDPEEQTFGGRTYVRRKTETGKPVCVFADGKIVVAAQEEKHLRRLIIAGAEGATRSKWASLWRSAADADAIALVNIQKLRSSAALEGPFSLVGLFMGIPTQLAPLVELSTVLVTVEATDRVHARIQLAGDETIDLKKILTGAKAFVDFSQALLSSFRNEASSHDGQHAELTLELCDRIDGLLDTVTVRLNEGAVVEASVSVPEDEITQLFRIAQKLVVPN